MGADTFFAISQTTDSNVFQCVSLRAVDFKGHQKEREGGYSVTALKPNKFFETERKLS